MTRSEGTTAAARRGGWLRTLVKVLVSAALMAFLFHRISVPELMRLVRGLDPAAFAGAVVCFLLSNVLGAVQWHRLLDASGVRMRFRRSFHFYFVGLFFNNFLPANIGGDAVKVYDVSRVANTVYPVLAATLLDRLIGIFSLCLLASVATLHLTGVLGPSPYAWYLLVFGACMAPAAALYFFRPLGGLVRRLVALIRPLSLDVRISALLDELSAFRRRRGVILRLVGLSLVIQILRVLTHVFVGVALGVHLESLILSQFFVFVPLLSLAMIPPITINGLGIREGLGILLFAAAGLPEADAFTMEFLTWVISVAVSLLGFAFFLARRHRRPPDPVSPFQS